VASAEKTKLEDRKYNLKVIKVLFNLTQGQSVKFDLILFYLLIIASRPNISNDFYAVIHLLLYLVFISLYLIIPCLVAQNPLEYNMSYNCYNNSVSLIYDSMIRYKYHITIQHSWKSKYIMGYAYYYCQTGHDRLGALITNR